LSAAQQRLATLEGEMTELYAQLQEAIAHAEREAKATTASSESARQATEVAHEASTDRKALLAENGALRSGLIFVRREHWRALADRDLLFHHERDAMLERWKMTVRSATQLVAENHRLRPFKSVATWAVNQLRVRPAEVTGACGCSCLDIMAFS
jgi:hypothetical protein